MSELLFDFVCYSAFNILMRMMVVRVVVVVAMVVVVMMIMYTCTHTYLHVCI